MSIRPTKDPEKWIIDYYPQGRAGKRVRIVFPGTESQARMFELEARRNGNSSLPNTANPKIIDIIPEYMDWLKLHRAQKTHEDVKLSLKWLLPHFGKLQVQRITPTIINQYKLCRGQHVRAINKELNYLKGIIKYMVTNGYTNPLTFKIEMLPYKPSIPQIPHPNEIEKFVREIKDSGKKAMVLLMFWAGLRYKDAKNIRWERINWDTQTINLSETKGSVPRLCIMTETVKTLLAPLKKPSGYVFANPKTGKPYGSLKTLFKNASKRAGIRRIHPHLLRHAIGTYTLEATGDLRLVQEFLGHKSINTTQIYTQIATSRKKSGMAQTADYIRQLSTSQDVDNKEVKK